jgi:hypothetical protein
MTATGKEAFFEVKNKNHFFPRIVGEDTALKSDDINNKIWQ